MNVLDTIAQAIGSFNKPKFLSPLPESETFDNPNALVVAATRQKHGEARYRDILAQEAAKNAANPTPTPAPAGGIPAARGAFSAMAAPILQKYQIPLSVGLGMAAAETNSGDNRTPKGYASRNNFYNITAYDRNPDMASGYATPQQGIDRFGHLLANDPRYAKAYAARNNPKQMMQEIQKAGYASRPDYASFVMSTPEFQQNLPQP